MKIFLDRPLPRVHLSVQRQPAAVRKKMMTTIKNIRIAFDGGGGAIIWSRNYAHSYNDGQQLAADVLCILAGGDINAWDGNDEDLRDAMRKDPTGCEHYPGRYDVYTLAEVADLLANASVKVDEDGVSILDGRSNSHLSGHTESAFFRAVSAR